MSTRFIELAGEINTAPPWHVIDRLIEGLNARGKALRDTKILLIGVAYKRDVDDGRRSPALAIAKLLEAKLAHVDYYDPRVPVLQSGQLPLCEIDQTNATGCRRSSFSRRTVHTSTIA